MFEQATIAWTLIGCAFPQDFVRKQTETNRIRLELFPRVYLLYHHMFIEGFPVRRCAAVCLEDVHWSNTAGFNKIVMGLGCLYEIRLYVDSVRIM